MCMDSKYYSVLVSDKMHRLCNVETAVGVCERVYQTYNFLNIIVDEDNKSYL